MPKDPRGEKRPLIWSAQPLRSCASLSASGPAHHEISIPLPAFGTARLAFLLQSRTMAGRSRRWWPRASGLAMAGEFSGLVNFSAVRRPRNRHFPPSARNHSQPSLILGEPWDREWMRPTVEAALPVGGYVQK